MRVPTDDLWNQACSLHLDNKFDEAEAIYTRLLEQNPFNSGLLATLGSLYIQTQRPGLAIHFLETAIKEGLKQADVYTNLGLAYKASGQVHLARKWFHDSITDSPTPEAYTNYSAMFIECGEDEKCIDLCEKAIKQKNDLPVAHWNMAIALLANGHWETGWKEYEWGIGLPSMREDRKVVDVPFWDGTTGKTVLLYGEQGLGDEIMFASMIPDLLKTNKVILESHRKLTHLFRKSFPEITVHGTREDREITWSPEGIDYRLSIGSLAKFYRNKREDFPGTPYLKADPLPKGEKFRVGISWTGGGPKPGRVAKRSVPLSWWKSILNVPNVEFVSLQYTDQKEELDLMDALGYPIKRMDEYVKVNDYYETARLVASCDLVISVCTSIIHLAGALGVPCWVMTPRWPAWRYQNQGGMPWYRSVRLYRAPDIEQGAWKPVISRIGLDLDDLVNEKKQKVA
jgi:tetratricopeptide (TPR) repeat protein